MKRFDAVAITGEYTDREGKQKKRYTKVGVAFQYDDGGMSVILDAVPAPEADREGRMKHIFRLFEPKPRDGAPSGGGGGGSHRDDFGDMPF